MAKDIIDDPQYYVKFPTAFMTVDMVVIKEGKIYLGQKIIDGKLYRFPGGFVDPKDSCIEEAACHELYEEFGIFPKKMTRLFDKRIDDSRYVNTPHSLITTVFLVEDFVGVPTAGDDLNAVYEIELNKLLYANDFKPSIINSNYHLIPNHKILMKETIKYIS